jgi:hypothetical protein
MYICTFVNSVCYWWLNVHVFRATMSENCILVPSLQSQWFLGTALNARSFDVDTYKVYLFYMTRVSS